MNTTPPVPQPGHAACCRDCVHRLPDLSHPSPCLLVRWDDNKHVKPDLKFWSIDQAVTCDSYTPAETSPAPQTQTEGSLVLRSAPEAKASDA